MNAKKFFLYMLGVHLATFIVLLAALYGFSVLHKESWVIGFILISVNNVLMIVGWSVLIFKKLIAIALPGVVLKYTILAGLLYLILTSSEYHLVSLMAGMGIGFIATVVSVVMGRQNLSHVGLKT